MKKILLLIVAIQVAASGFTQDFQENARVKKAGISKAQKTMRVGWIIMGSGAVCLIGGILTTQPDTDENPSDNTVSKVLLFTGITAFCTGIITVVIGAASRDRYYRIIGGSETIPTLKSGSFVYKRIPAIRLQIPL